MACIFREINKFESKTLFGKKRLSNSSDAHAASPIQAHALPRRTPDGAAGIDVTMVPHRSGNDAMNAVVAGDIPLIIEAPTTVAPHVQSGKLKALVVTGQEREPLLPQTPTAAESGFDVQGEAWIGLVAPNGTPQAVVQRLNREVRILLETPEMRALMARLSFRTLSSTPEEFGKLIRKEHAKWGPAIREAGFKLE